ncbi:MAG: GNAT family N-acetyltransferase [Chloroflexi bacterium]|nr:MAG: GNAT family N-acetyltransferase [Chloroflexota bacterium]
MNISRGKRMNEQEDIIQIRRATADDVLSIATVLHTAFIEYEHYYTHEAFAATTPSAEGIRQRMSEGPTWVALHNECIIGTVSAVVKGPLCYVRGMAILPTARGQRIGARLLEHVEQFAAEQGADRLYLSTALFLERAVCLYERCGFERSEEEGALELFGTPVFMMVKRLGL